jgi:hypothetical protein
MYKELFSAVAIVLTFLALLPYIRSIKQGITRPHVFSWVIWGSATLVIFLAQLSDNAGAGAWPIGVSSILTLYIAYLAWVKTLDNTITRIDWWFLILAISALPLWYFTADPLWAVVIMTVVDLSGFGPTLRKAYAHPHDEQLMFYMIFVVRNIFIIFALEHYSPTTLLFPAVTAVACLSLVLLLILRRRALAELHS